MNFLFWNTKKNPGITPVLRAITQDLRTEVLILAESGSQPSEIQQSVPGMIPLMQRGISCDRIQMYTTLDPDQFLNLQNEKHCSAWQCQPENAPGFSLIAVHLPSKLYLDESDHRAYISQNLMPFIHDIEERQGHNRTVICGDFNMNPFEAGMVEAGALHAVMDRQIAERGGRTVQGRRFRFFYNPMWGYLGDLGRGGAPGTHYYPGGGYATLFWNMFDQVLIRPELIPYFDDDFLQMITNSGNLKLLEANGVIHKDISDHLPISFKLNFHHAG